MFKKIFTIIALGTMFLSLPSARADDVYQTIDVFEGQYPNINFQPRTLHINQGDTLHITVRNTRTGFTRIFMPSINLTQDIAPGNRAIFDICISNPTAKTMWFQISSPAAKKVPGYIVVNNFQVPRVADSGKVVDISALDNIINYSKEYCYAEKENPKYNLSEPRPEVKGCW